MLITITRDRFGGLSINPKSDRVRRKYVRYLKEWESSGAYVPRDRDSLVYLQNEEEVETFLDEYVPPAKHRDLRQGWDVTVRIDPWIFGHFVGWDAHEMEV